MGLSQASDWSVSTFRALTVAWEASPERPIYAYAQSALVPPTSAYLPAYPSGSVGMGRRAGQYLIRVQRFSAPRHHVGLQEPENLLFGPCSRTRYTGVAIEPHRLRTLTAVPAGSAAWG